jgi:hypothetical protein
MISPTQIIGPTQGIIECTRLFDTGLTLSECQKYQLFDGAGKNMEIM